MMVQTGRFGQIEVSSDEVIHMPSGILGFPDEHDFCLVDPADDTMILWFQSLKSPQLAFPVLEPRIFKPSYVVRLSAAELRELRLASINDASVYTILTLPQNLIDMTANLKAPLVINVKDKVAKQVVLQENDQPIKFPMFKELRAHLMTASAQSNQADRVAARTEMGALQVASLPLSTAVQLT
jgi:flagellar assembly factor FliW